VGWELQSIGVYIGRRTYIRARICNRSMSPGIDSKESSPTAYVAWRTDKITPFVVPPARGEENSALFAKWNFWPKSSSEVQMTSKSKSLPMLLMNRTFFLSGRIFLQDWLEIFAKSCQHWQVHKRQSWRLLPRCWPHVLLQGVLIIDWWAHCHLYS